MDRLISELLDLPDQVYIHRFVVTETELRLYLSKWVQKKYRDHPILYLTCHGDSGSLFFSSSRRDPGISLDSLEELLAEKCKGRVIYFGSCSTLDLEGQRIAQFLSVTGALAVCGYRCYVDWRTGAAFELMFLTAMQGNAPTIAGMKAVKRRIRWEAATLVKNLGFHMVIRKGRRRNPSP